MTHESTLKAKQAHFFNDEVGQSTLIPLHKWLMISASVLMFVVLPLLFVWSSLSIIHPVSSEQNSFFSETDTFNEPSVLSD